MSRTLLIMRHAKSDWSSDAPTDFSRPLARRGEKAAPKMARWLKEKGIQPDYCISSPAVRARQTALFVVHRLGMPESRVIWDERIYLAHRVTLLQVLGESPLDAGTVLLVGHNPGMEELLEYLAGEKCPEPLNGKLLPTAAIGILAMPENWRNLERGAAVACEVKRPREL